MESQIFDVNLIEYNDQVLHCKVVFPENKKVIFCSFVYAANKYTERRMLWSSLEYHNILVKNDPWVICGDFNVTLKLNESTVDISRFTRGMVEFLECVNKIKIQDVNCNGLNFT